TTFAPSRHVCFLSGDEARLFEQCYNHKDASPSGALVELSPPRAASGPAYNTWSMAAMLAAVLLLMIGSTHRRPVDMSAGADAKPLQVAPLGQRLLGGIIDLLPALATLVILQLRTRRPTQLSEMPPWHIGVSVAVYLLFTVISETLLGRSVGKMAAGLRVVGIDGLPPGAVALIVRNLLRVMDVPLIALVLFSPLRQRFGDLAAGTVVVTAGSGE